MAAVVILYTPPEHPDEFEHKYIAEYLPTVQALPEVSRLTTLQVAGGPYGDPPYYRVETWHLSEQAEPSVVFQRSVWRSAPDLVGFALGLATPMFVEGPTSER
jgi:hypothetical protein